ncbi:MAG: patatin-like phospholipase family protein [Candidatus Acidiferrales bacterium]
MATYRILALDGGGIRGIYTAVLLNRIAQEVPGFTDRADLLAGTSTGGIIALGLAKGMVPADLVNLYRDNGKTIFSRDLLHEIGDLGNLVGAKYDNTDLIEIIDRTFGDGKLKELLPRHVLIPSFDLDNKAVPPKLRTWKPKFYHNYAGPQSDGDENIADVALRTSAAPTYFPVYQGYVDGGVVANNPAMAALAQAIDNVTGGQQLADLRLFSVGTGLTPVFVSGDEHNWGLAQWAQILADMMLGGMVGVADYECARLLGNNYFRLTPILPTPITLDDVAKIQDLIDDANQVDIKAAVSWVKTNFA